MSKRSRFVRAGTVRLDLTEDDWIEIKAELTYGEEQHLASVGLTSIRENADVQGGSELGINWGALNLAKIQTWVTEWSFVDDRGRVQPVNMSTIKNLGKDDATEILNAIEAYEEKQAQLKNDSSSSESESPTRSNVAVTVSTKSS